MMLRELNNFTAAKADIVIQPEADEVDMFDNSKRDYLMRVGEKAGQAAVPAIKKILAKRGIPLEKNELS